MGLVRKGFIVLTIQKLMIVSVIGMLSGKHGVIYTGCCEDW